MGNKFTTVTKNFFYMNQPMNLPSYVSTPYTHSSLVISAWLTIILFPVRMSDNVRLREKRPYSEFFWYVFSLKEYEETQSVFPYLVRMQENKDQRNSEYKHFSLLTNRSSPPELFLGSGVLTICSKFTEEVAL